MLEDFLSKEDFIKWKKLIDNDIEKNANDYYQNLYHKWFFDIKDEKSWYEEIRDIIDADN